MGSNNINNANIYNKEVSVQYQSVYIQCCKTWRTVSMEPFSTIQYCELTVIFNVRIYHCLPIFLFLPINIYLWKLHNTTFNTWLVLYSICN